MEFLSRLFYGTIERWNNWLAYLEFEADKKEKQIITLDQAEKLPKVQPHLVLKSFNESTFPYNLNGREIPKTGNTQADLWLQDFGYLNIDAYQMIRKEQTLPDSTFLKKRYLNIQKQVHPDQGGSTQESTLVNVAKETLDRFYEDPIEQITLFQAVFSVQEKPDVSTIQNTVTTTSSSPYILLYLIGSGIGTILVLRRGKKKSTLN